MRACARWQVSVSETRMRCLHVKRYVWVLTSSHTIVHIHNHHHKHQKCTTRGSSRLTKSTRNISERKTLQQSIRVSNLNKSDEYWGRGVRNEECICSHLGEKESSPIISLEFNVHHHRHSVLWPKYLPLSLLRWWHSKMSVSHERLEATQWVWVRASAWEKSVCVFQKTNRNVLFVNHC